RLRTLGPVLSPGFPDPELVLSLRGFRTLRATILRLLFHNRLLLHRSQTRNPEHRVLVLLAAFHPLQRALVDEGLDDGGALATPHPQPARENRVAFDALQAHAGLVPGVLSDSDQRPALPRGEVVGGVVKDLDHEPDTHQAPPFVGADRYPVMCVHAHACMVTTRVDLLGVLERRQDGWPRACQVLPHQAGPFCLVMAGRSLARRTPRRTPGAAAQSGIGKVYRSLKRWAMYTPRAYSTGLPSLVRVTRCISRMGSLGRMPKMSASSEVGMRAFVSSVISWGSSPRSAKTAKPPPLPAIPGRSSMIGVPSTCSCL